MKIDEFENIILKEAYDFMIKEGRKHYENGLVKKVRGKKFEEFYSLYGEVENELPKAVFNTYIKIDLNKKCIEKTQCDCSTFKGLSSNKKNFLCSHLTATVYKFLKEVKKNTKLDASAEKKSASNIKLIRKNLSNTIHYELRANLGSDKTIIQPEKLREVLNKMINKKIKFTYEHLEITSIIIKKDLPLKFTVKERNGQIVVTSHKKLPIPLTPNNDVYFFENELYLPSSEQKEKYLPIYNKLKNSSELVYQLNIEYYNKVISQLNSISCNIDIREELKNFAAQYNKVDFVLYKELDKVYCKVYVIYGNKKVDILEDSRELAIRYRKREELLLIKICNHKFLRREGKLEFIGDDEDLFNILKNKNEELSSLGNVVLKESASKLIYNHNSISTNLYEEDGFYKIAYHIENFQYRELNSAYEAFKSKKSFYKSKHGFLDLEDDGVRNLFNLVDGINFKESIENEVITIDKNKGMYLRELAKTLPRLSGIENLEDIEEVLREEVNIPKNFKGTLRSYQVEGYKWLKHLSKLGLGGILADEMGLGKTIQTIAFVLSEEGKRFIIVAPTSLIYNWEAEFMKFANSLKIGVVHGSGRDKILKNIQDYDVILTTYGTLKSDSDFYKSISFDYCFIDEAQNIKNYEAENSRTVKRINSKVNFALTGTPIENNLMELWSIFDFVNPGYLYTSEEFKRKFVTGDVDLDTLKSLINPFILRRTKIEVAKDLPDKIEKQILVEMTREQSDIYKAYTKSIKEKLMVKEKNKIEVFSYLTKLRQICLDPSLIVEDYVGESGKVKVALKLIEDAEGKVLLFSQFTSVLDKLAKMLEGKNINYFHIDGKTPSKTRIDRVHDFNNSTGKNVFLISLKAGGTGLNLTSATTVIHFDPWWNPAVEDQATDRAHRIGQKHVVEVIKLIAKGTIEEKIVLLQEDKKELIDNIITGQLKETNLINKLSQEDVLRLIM